MHTMPYCRYLGICTPAAYSRISSACLATVVHVQSTPSDTSGVKTGTLAWWIVIQVMHAYLKFLENRTRLTARGNPHPAFQSTEDTAGCRTCRGSGVDSRLVASESNPAPDLSVGWKSKNCDICQAILIQK